METRDNEEIIGYNGNFEWNGIYLSESISWTEHWTTEK
jgi:hypothetical protein